MPDFIDRYAAKSLLPPEISREIIQGTVKYSVGMQIFKRGMSMTADADFKLALPCFSISASYFSTLAFSDSNFLFDSSFSLNNSGLNFCTASRTFFLVIDLGLGPCLGIATSSVAR